MGNADRMPPFPNTPAPLSELIRAPNFGYPPNPGQDRPGLSPWGRLCAGGAMGKTTLVPYSALATKTQPSAFPMLQLQGDDMDATQLVITLAPPQVIALAPADVPENIQSAPSGGQGNDEVTLGNFPGSGAPIQWPPLEAVVQWGVGGSSTQAVLDYVNGVTFSVTASWVRVLAQISQNHVNGDISGTPAQYVVGAFVGPGVTFSPNAQRTVYVDSIANNASSLVFEVPRFARRALVVGCDPAAAATTAATLSFWQSPNATHNVGNFFQSGNQPGPFLIPNAAQYFTVTNTSGTDMLMSVVFELALS